MGKATLVLSVIFVCACCAFGQDSVVATITRNDWTGASSQDVELTAPQAVSFWLADRAFAAGSNNVGRQQYFDLPATDVTFDFTPENCTTFASLATMLTNGVDDYLYEGFLLKDSVGPGGKKLESLWGLGSPDLHGYTLSMIRLTIADAAVEVRSEHEWRFDSHLTWEFIGSPVPEPATLSLLAFGGLAVLRRRNTAR